MTSLNTANQATDSISDDVLSNVTINHDQRLFVIKQSNGYSCHGFDIVKDKVEAISRMIIDTGKASAGLVDTLKELQQTQVGTLEQYDAYLKIVNLAKEYPIGTYYSPKTPDKVKSVLESAMRDKSTLRVFYGKDGVDWMEENDTIGRIGRSTGWIKIPLLIAKNADGGPGLLEDCIVRIIDIDRNKELYRHPNYQLKGQLNIVETTPDMIEKGITHDVKVGDEVHARFESFEMAASFVSFISGNTHEKPWECVKVKKAKYSMT